MAIVLLVAGGAAFLPGALDRFVFPKLAVVAAGIAIASTVHPRGVLPRAALVMLAAAGVVLLLAALSGRDPSAALLGRAPRYEGLVALPVYVGALAAGARLLGPGRAPGAGRLLLDTLALAALAIGTLAVLEATGLRPLSSTASRPGSLLGNASDQGAWALLAAGPLAATSLRDPDTLHIAGLLGAAAALVTSGSRGALAGAVVLAIVLASLVRDRRRKLAVAATLALLAVAVFAVPAQRARVLESSPIAKHTANGRLMLWSETARLIADRPLLGTGPSGYEDAIPAYHSREYERQVGPANPPDSPHNWILQAGAAGGIPLALLALALAVLTLLRGVSATRQQPQPAERALALGMLASLTGYAIALLFYFTTAGSTPLAALYAGALLSAPAPARSRAISRMADLRSMAAATAYAALTVVLIFGALAELPLRTALVDITRGHVAAADNEFHSAENLRPWDPSIAQAATHAYAVLARDHVPGAASLGLPWASDELRAYPDTIQALQDAAILANAVGRSQKADRLLGRARQLEPNNPELRP